RAAERGHATAAHNIAAYYATGTGVERDGRKALEWYTIATTRGITASCVPLGKLLYPADQNLAIDLFEKAAAGGDREAKIALAMLLLQGEGIVHDPSRGKELLKQAAGSGYAVAARELGHLYFGKYGANAHAVDRGEAFRWYTKAA